MAITLYHFTKPEHWPAIASSGTLEPRWTAAGPDVVPTVHLMDTPNRELLPWAFREDYTVRIQVSVPEVEVHNWHTWGKVRVPANAHISWGIPVSRPEGTYLSHGNKGSAHWRVVERSIPQSEWVRVEDLDTDQVLWSSAEA
ncbi:hypothetical protein [Streptomyces sp. NPDC056069]|uniref:hypothetical protein n=1 Tax=Streptomyces sp. NPDC056069 TaxID=3345702 RepID=UPI0035DB35EA